MKIKYTPESATLGEWGEKEISELNIRAAWVEYTNYGYDGGGYFIGQKYTGEYFFKDLGHCSCYGPLDGLEAAMRETYDTRALLLGGCTQELRESLSRILKTAV